MLATEFSFFAEFLKRRSGLALPAHKAHLIERQLGPLAARHGLNVGALIGELKTGNAPLARAAVEAMTTSETSFFRDKTPFERFRAVILPALLKARADQRRMRIWCAGVSTGQEAYSLAMVLDEMKHTLDGWTIDLLAADINEAAIERASAGLYDDREVQRGLPIDMLARHFRREGGQWRLKDAIRHKVQFRVFNLMESFSGLGIFDIVFCRNVLIYFDRETKAKVVGRFSAALATDGYLVLGAAETALGLDGVFTPLAHARGICLKARRAPRPVRVLDLALAAG